MYIRPDTGQTQQKTQSQFCTIEAWLSRLRCKMPSVEPAACGQSYAWRSLRDATTKGGDTCSDAITWDPVVKRRTDRPGMLRTAKWSHVFTHVTHVQPKAYEDESHAAHARLHFEHKLVTAASLKDRHTKWAEGWPTQYWSRKANIAWRHGERVEPPCIIKLNR